eukprot:gnl/Dysnectes_brevis/430_a473_7135.p1 GENE.gnl/Dysnectes_brevis/430_a473_7135~~gnl/Dysnectes_brevis/430_a473_7135.p1  ORF type:complete len:150 (-),score=22.88 gnl/Dysnectes_brevis/430_a473_7135:70-468(-)
MGDTVSKLSCKGSKAKSVSEPTMQEETTTSETPIEPIQDEPVESVLTETETSSITSAFNSAFPEPISLDRFDNWFEVIVGSLQGLSLLPAELEEGFESTFKTRVSERVTEAGNLTLEITLALVSELKTAQVE